MTKNVININNVQVDADLFAAYNKEAMDRLTVAAKHKDDASEALKDFKETVERVHLSTKISKAELTKYFKARWEETQPKDDEDKAAGTQVIIKRGELHATLNSVLGDENDE